MGSMGNRNHSLQFQHSMRSTAGVNVVILPTPLKTFVKQRKTLPVFSGSEKGALIEDWLQECEKTAAILRWAEYQKIQEFSKKLSGIARTFHEAQLKTITDYKTWRRSMMQNFVQQEQKKEILVKQLMDLKQKPNQSVRDFAQEISSLTVKILGLAVVTDKMYKTFCLNTKLAYFSDGLRQDVWERLSSFILNNRGRSPSWSRIVQHGQDIEWLIDLKKKSASITPQCGGEDHTKVYIAISADSTRKFTGYGVFFGKGDSKNICEVSRFTINASLIIAAIKAIMKAKTCGLNRLIIYTSSEYLLKFVDEWAVPWLERKWFSVRNVNFWRDLLSHLEGIDVKWEKPNFKEFGYSEACKLAKIAKSKYQ